MSNRKRTISGTGKELLDAFIARATLERPIALKIALAKGISLSPTHFESVKDDKQKWTIPEGIIKDREYLLLKQLIIQEQQKNLDEDTINDFIANYIEVGLRALDQIMSEKSSLEDFRIKMLQ